MKQTGKQQESTRRDGREGAPPIQEGADYGEIGTFRDNPDKPAPESVAQEQVLPEDK